MHILQRKLDLFRNRFRGGVEEYILETLFLYGGLFFFLTVLPDYILWCWKFLEIPLLRWCFFILFGVFLLWEWKRFLTLWYRIPSTRIETLQLLKTMNARFSKSNDPSVSPSLPESLESALDFLENKQPKEGEELRKAVILQVDAAMIEFEPSEWLQLEHFWRVRWRLRVGVCFLATVFCILTVCSAEFTQTAMKRVTMPWKETPWKINFQPQWRNLPAEVLEGETFDAEIVLQTSVPFLQAVIWESEDALEPSGILKITPIFGRFFIRIPNVRKSFFISITIPGENLLLQKRYKVHVRTFPKLTNVILRIQAPDVTHQKPKETGWEIKGVSGSRVGIMIATDRPLKAAKLRFSNATYIPGEPTESGKKSEKESNVFKFRFELLQDCDYWLELTDQTGLTTKLEKHTITTLEDLKPTVLCEAPESGRPLLPGARVSVNLNAQDDFGLTSLGFRWVTETPDSKEESGFSFPKTRNGIPKWTVLNVWDAVNPETGEIPEEPLPLSQSSKFSWDLSTVTLKAGMRLRVEPYSTDVQEQRTFGTPIFLNVVTPEEMQLYTFRQWISITRDLRNMGGLLTQCRERVEAMTQKNSVETSEFLVKTMDSIHKLMDSQEPEGLPARITLLDEELSENPAFPFHEKVTSKVQLQTLCEMKELLETFNGEFFPALNQEIVQLAKRLRNVTEISEEKKTEILQILDEILNRMDPWLKDWNREEYADAMRFDFAALCERQEKIMKRLFPVLIQAVNQTPMELYHANMQVLLDSEKEFWEIHRELEQFCNRFGKLYGPEFMREIDSELLQPLNLALDALQTRRFWDLQRFCIGIESSFYSVEKRWIQFGGTQPLGERMSFFHKMLVSQENILHFMEHCLEPEHILKPQNEKEEVIPITRNNRKVFRDCARIQEEFSTCVMGNPKFTLPEALKNLWEELNSNFQISIEEFRTISTLEKPPFEMVKEQYSIQLQIYDQLAEITQIADGVQEETGEFVKNSELENRISSQKKMETQEESESGEKIEIKPEDIQILISMQKLVLEQTKSLEGNRSLQNDEKAAELEFLTIQEQKIVASAENLGFAKQPNSTFDGLLTQMNQVVFLLEKKAAGSMTVSIQEEILYGLQKSLQKKEAPETILESAETQNETTQNPENLSENTESKASQNQTKGEVKTEESGLKNTLEMIQNSFWGELPQREQEALQLLPEEKPIPGYRNMLERYYRNLRE